MASPAKRATFFVLVSVTSCFFVLLSAASGLMIHGICEFEHLRYCVSFTADGMDTLQRLDAPLRATPQSRIRDALPASLRSTTPSSFSATSTTLSVTSIQSSRHFLSRLAASWSRGNSCQSFTLRSSSFQLKACARVSLPSSEKACSSRCWRSWQQALSRFPSTTPFFAGMARVTDTASRFQQKQHGQCLSPRQQCSCFPPGMRTPRGGRTTLCLFGKSTLCSSL